jgi:hypothetical protein
VDELDDLGEIAHVEPLTTARAFHEVIGFGLSHAIGVAAGLGHSSLLSLRFPSVFPCDLN